MEDYSTVEYWNERARINKGKAQKCLFDDNRFNEFERYQKRLLCALISPGIKVLDVACGYGRLASHVISCQAHWRGIDFSEEMRNQCSEDNRKFILLGDARKPEETLKGMTFDLIYEVNSAKVLTMLVDQFKGVYSKFLNPHGTLAYIEHDVTHVYTDFRSTR